MAATNKAKSLSVLGKNRQEEIREKIKATLIVNKLQNHMDGTLELTATQISAAKILLDKALSNAPLITENKTEHSGTVNHIVAKRPKLTREEWLKTLAK